MNLDEGRGGGEGGDGVHDDDVFIDAAVDALTPARRAAVERGSASRKTAAAAAAAAADEPENFKSARARIEAFSKNPDGVSTPGLTPRGAQIPGGACQILLATSSNAFSILVA